MNTTYKLNVKSASKSLTARFSILCALKLLVDNGMISQSYLTRYKNKNTSRSSALRYVRAHALFAIRPVATDGNVVCYEVFLQITTHDEPTHKVNLFARPDVKVSDQALNAQEDGYTTPELITEGEPSCGHTNCLGCPDTECVNCK